MNDERARIDELLSIMNEHDLDALTVKSGDLAYELVRRDQGREARTLPVESAVPGSAEPAARTQSPGANTKTIAAPIIGVFYRAAAPGLEPFVEVGDRVSVGQVLCILEAMKMMNEITSDHAGVVTRILPDNGQLVSLGEEMFWIEA